MESLAGLGTKILCGGAFVIHDERLSDKASKGRNHTELVNPHPSLGVCELHTTVSDASSIILGFDTLFAMWAKVHKHITVKSNKNPAWIDFKPNIIKSDRASPLRIAVAGYFNDETFPSLLNREEQSCRDGGYNETSTEITERAAAR